MNGGIDLFTSRRDMNNYCVYWKQNEDEDVVSINEIVYNKEPYGFFYAAEVSSLTKENQVVGQVVMFSKRDITLRTTDYVKDLDENDIVKYNDEYWRVENVQFKKKKKQGFFMDVDSGEYYIHLRR